MGVAGVGCKVLNDVGDVVCVCVAVGLELGKYDGAPVGVEVVVAVSERLLSVPDPVGLDDEGKNVVGVKEGTTFL